MSAAHRLESGYRCIPVSAAEAAANLRLCVVVREQPNPIAGHFVLLRQTSGARVLLGAICDAEGHAREWVELWLQDCASASAGESRVAASNAARDEAWAALVAGLRAADAEGACSTAYECDPPLPTYLRTDTWQPWHPQVEGRELRLCREDALLTAAGLEPYGLSAARYATVAGQLFALNAAAIQLEGPLQRPVPLAREIPIGEIPVTPFNPAAGFLFVRRFAPLALEEYADVLGGRAWSGLGNAGLPLKLPGVYEELDDERTMRVGGRHFQGSRRDLAGRTVESLTLKLILLEQCVRVVAEETRRSELPLLNLAADSFRVSLAAAGGNLPFLWTARVSLVHPGEARALDLPSSRVRHFESRVPLTGSVYRPRALFLTRGGSGTVRLKRTLPPVEDGVVAEGTITTDESVSFAANEVVKLRLPRPGFGGFEIYGTCSESGALTAGELVFRSLPMLHDEAEAALLRSYLGVPLKRVPMEVVRPLSSPCDLYSLGVLGLRLLFAGSTMPLETLHDALHSLAKRLAAEPAGEAPLEKQIEEIFTKEPQWNQVLGPQHVLRAPLHTHDAAAALPLAAWSFVLATLLPFFHGYRFSFCRDLADAPSLAPQAIYQRPLQVLERARLRAQALFLGDWRRNSEILALIAARSGLAVSELG